VTDRAGSLVTFLPVKFIAYNHKVLEVSTRIRLNGWAYFPGKLVSNALEFSSSTFRENNVSGATQAVFYDSE